MFLGLSTASDGSTNQAIQYADVSAYRNILQMIKDYRLTLQHNKDIVYNMLVFTVPNPAIIGTSISALGTKSYGKSSPFALVQKVMKNAGYKTAYTSKSIASFQLPFSDIFPHVINGGYQNVYSIPVTPPSASGFTIATIQTELNRVRLPLPTNFVQLMYQIQNGPINPLIYRAGYRKLGHWHPPTFHINDTAWVSDIDLMNSYAKVGQALDEIESLVNSTIKKAQVASQVQSSTIKSEAAPIPAVKTTTQTAPPTPTAQPTVTANGITKPQVSVNPAVKNILQPSPAVVQSSPVAVTTPTVSSPAATTPVTTAAPTNKTGTGVKIALGIAAALLAFH